MMSRLVCVWAMILFSGYGAAGQPGPVFAELEVERDAKTSRLTVYIVNESSKDLKLKTGSYGGPGQYDDRINGLIYGTEISALPEITFRSSEHRITVRAPSMTSQMTSRDMQSFVLTIPAGTRQRYYSFEVPSSHLGERFVRGHITFPWANEVRDHFSRGTEALTIPIIRVVDSNRGRHDP